MIELWTKDQIREKIAPEEFHRVGLFLSQQEEPEGMNVASVDSNGNPVAWEVVQFKYIPAESIYAVLKLVGKSLLLEGFADQDGVTLTQVFRRVKMIPQTDYVNLAEYNKDPGDVGSFGQLMR